MDDPRSESYLGNTKKEKIGNSINWLLTLIAAVAGLYSVYVSEYGPINKEPALNFLIHDKISLQQEYGAFFFNVPFHIINTGNDYGSIYKMKAIIERKDSNFKKIFKWNFVPLTIKPDEKLNLNVVFSSSFRLGSCM